MSLAGMIELDIIGSGQREREHFGSFTIGVTPEAINEIYPNAQRSITCGVLERFPSQCSYGSGPPGVNYRGNTRPSIDGHDRLLRIT